MIYILYHANCFDGFGSAFCAWKKYGNDATYIPCTYGEPLPNNIPDNSEIYMIDFSGPRDVMIEWSKKYKFTVIDHHLSAMQNLEGLDFAHFDMTKSGALLAWEYFHPTYPIPNLISYISDHDLWQHKLSNSKEVHAALASYPFDFEIWNGFLYNVEQLIEEGQVLLRYQDVLVKMICEKTHEVVLGEHKIMAVNSTSHWSEIGNYLCKTYPDYPFCASFFYNKHGKKVWSLRSIGEFDVSSIAKAYGGGGHRNAAGFEEK